MEISYQLKCLGWTQSKLARELNVSPSLANNVIHNRITAYHIAIEITKLLNSDLKTLWPNRCTFKPRNENNKEIT